MKIEYEELDFSHLSHNIMEHHISISTNLTSKQKLRDQIGLFESQGTNLILETKLKEQNGYFAPK